MKLKVTLQYSDNRITNIMFYQDASTTIGQLCKYLQSKCQINNPIILSEGYQILEDQIIGNVLDENSIIIVIEGSQNTNQSKQSKIAQKQIQKHYNPNIKKQAEVSSDSSSSEEDLPQPKQIPIKSKINNSQPLKGLVAFPKTNQQQTQQKIKNPLIVPTKSESESSSVQDIIVKKPNPQNKLNLKFKSPEQEIKDKQADWKKTFVKSQIVQQKPNQQKNNQKTDQKPTIKLTETLIIDEFQKIPSILLKDDPTILQKDDELLFRYHYLNLETCQPAISELLSGIVIENNAVDRFVTIQTKVKDKEKLKLTHSEFQELQINLAIISQARKDAIRKANEPEIPILIPSLTEKSTEKKQIVVDPLGIGQQINYYYSDKNYLKDEYIQQHSAQDPEKYMLFKLLLNFPKVKSKINDINELLAVVQLFLSKNPTNVINFEIKQNQDGDWLIRKRILSQNQ